MTPEEMEARGLAQTCGVCGARPTEPCRRRIMRVGRAARLDDPENVTEYFGPGEGPVRPKVHRSRRL